MSERQNFGTLREVIPPPNLIENQINSYIAALEAKYENVEIINISYTTNRTISNSNVDHYCGLCYRYGDEKKIS